MPTIYSNDLVWTPSNIALVLWVPLKRLIRMAMASLLIKRDIDIQLEDLLYLRAGRSDIMFSVCLFTCCQSCSKEKHLIVVKWSSKYRT